MTDDPRGMVAVVGGSIVVAIGSTIAGINAFDGRVGWVMFGFVVFIAGYLVSQAGVHADGLPTPEGLLGGSPSTIVLRVALLVVGLAGISVGVTTFSRTILQPSLENAVLSGISSIGGYMAAHVGVNRTGLGWSFFARVRKASTYRGGDGRR